MSEALKNEIHAYFGKQNTTTTAPVKQWAYGQKLVIHDADLPNVFEAYYSNSRSRGTADPQIGTDGVVDAPHAYFRSGADIYVFLMVHEGTDDGRYNKIVHIPINPCPEPTDVEPEPYEQGVINQAIAVINSAVTQTAADVTAADASATAAAQSATDAQTAAQSAQGSATSASGSATTATNAAATATTKAGEAATSAANAQAAQNAAETAQGKAEAAQTASESAQASAQSAAQTATTKASEASTSATSASGSASAASASASAASESATNAAANATAASGSATNAATSAATASTKASEASASATAANTAKTDAQAAQTAAETAKTEAETARDETVAEAATIRGVLKDKADIIISNAEGAIATFEDGGNNMPMVSCVAKIEPVQSGSGDPAPDNVRPISGWTGANVRVTNKCIWGGLTMANDIVAIVNNASGSTKGSDANGDYVTITANAATSNKIIFNKFKPNTQYTFILKIGSSATSTGTNIVIEYSDTTNSYISFPSAPVVGTAYTLVVTSASGKTVESIKCLWSTGTNYLYYADCGLFEGVLTADQFEAYRGTTYPISWQSEVGTVYGGTLDVVSGVLTVDRAMVDLGELTFSATNTANIFYAGISDMRAGYSAKIVCEAYKRYSAYYTGMPDKSVANNSTYGYIYIKDTDYSDADTFMASLSGIYLAYEIKNPTTVQLTPHEVSTLLGQNNVWADTGDVEVQYRADTKLYIEAHTPDVPVEDVQVNGTSIVTDGIVNVPIADSNTFGLVKPMTGAGTAIAANGALAVVRSYNSDIKNGQNEYKPIVPCSQHVSTFYGLAKLAGVDMASSDNPVGTYTDEAKIAIQKMLGINLHGELIADVTVAEDATEILVSTDLNGQPFRLIKLVAIFSAGASTTGARDSFYASIGYGMDSIAYSYSTSIPSMQYNSATSTMFAKITVEALSGMPIDTKVIVGNSEGNTQNIQGMPKPAIADYLTALRIYQSASTKSLIPAGSNLKVYGIRA